MRRELFRQRAAVCLLAAGVLLLAGCVAANITFPKKDRYVSVYEAVPLPPLMGFSEDSVFNTGSAKELDQLPGIGEVLAQRIIEGRELVGEYRLPTDLLLVKGIGEKTLDGMMAALEEPLVELPLGGE